MIATGYLAAIAAAAAFAAGGGIAWTVQGYRLDACETRLSAAGRSLTEQTDATKALADQGAKARAAAADATKRASEAEAKAKGAEDALKAKMKAPGGPATCSAAWAEIRKGAK